MLWSAILIRLIVSFSTGNRSFSSDNESDVNTFYENTSSDAIVVKFNFSWIVYHITRLSFWI